MPRDFLQWARLSTVCLACILIAPFAHSHNRYEIKATLDPEKGEIQGVAQIAFLNETLTAIDAIPVTISNGKITRVASSAKKELQFQPARNEKSNYVLLESALLPGKSIQIQIMFSGAFPFNSSGYRLATEAWHPKALVFREGEFSPLERQPDSYDVTLTIPSSEIVATSGKLIAEKPLAKKMRELHYRAENITDFGIVSSPKFLETFREVEGATIRSLYFQGREKWGVKLADYAARIIPFYQKTFGFYPQNMLIILPGSKTSRGGYPPASNMIVVHDTLDDAGEVFAEWITSHEIGHQYWGFECVIDSGKYYHWPGLPLGIYTDRLYNEAFNPERTYGGFVENYLGGVARGYDTTILRTWAQIDSLSFDFNNIVAHGKAYAVIQMLEELVGKEKFFTLVLTLLKRYRNNYLSPQDFQAVAEEIGGQKLDWFFQDWVEGNKDLSYAIESVEQAGSEVNVRVRRSGSSGMPLELELLLEDGTRLRQTIRREPEVQTLTFEVRSKPRQARLDPGRRMALYSPESSHVWGRKLRVIEMRLPEKLVWGTNSLSAAVQNEDDQAHEMEIHVQSNNLSLPRGWGYQTKHTIAGGAKSIIDQPFILPAFPGKVRILVQARDLTNDLPFFRQEYFAEFPFANTSSAPLKLPPVLLKALRVSREVYPRLLMSEQGHFVFYYLEGDSFVENKIGEIARRRERAYRELAATINPAFQEKVAIYFFPDAESKLAYFGHRGMGWAPGGNILVEIFNEKEQLDPNHELVHIIAGSVGDPPALFSEGLAVYLQESEKWDGFHIDAWAKAFDEHKMLFPLEQILTFIEIGPEESKPAIAYPQAASIVKYLAGRYGFDKLMQAYKELKGGSDEAIIESNRRRFSQIFGISIANLEKDWLANLPEIKVEPVPEDKIEEIKTKYR
jgi:hypothetical protein